MEGLTGERGSWDQWQVKQVRLEGAGAAAN